MTPTRRTPFTVMILDRMRERNLGLRELCRAVGLDPSFFSKVLAGKRGPPSEEGDLRRIAEVLGLDAPALIVSAGRIPAEWAPLLRDRSLFESVHCMATGGGMKLASRPRPAGNWGRCEPQAPRRVERDMGEELL